MIKPTIKIFVFEPIKELLNEILLGIEEEGALFEVITTTVHNPKKSAHIAAHQSQVETGVGVSVSLAVLTTAKLYENTPITEINTFDKQKWRSLGANAARFVTRRPLVWQKGDVN